MIDSPTSLRPQGAGETIEKAELEVLERYGITRVPTAIYLVGAYRYSKLADAVAQAARACERNNTTNARLPGLAVRLGDGSGLRITGATNDRPEG